MPWRRESVAEAMTVEFEYRFDSEVSLAWRRPKGSKRVEVSLPLKFDSTELPSAPVIATWSDGHEHWVPGLTNSMLNCDGGSSSKTTGSLWSTTAVETRHQISIIQKVDRHLLLALTEQSRQVLQLRLSDFGPVGDESKQLPREDQTLVRALRFMQTIGGNFESGKIQKHELKIVCDEMFIAEGIKYSPQSEVGRVRRRPAAAVDVFAEKGPPAKQPKTPAAQHDEEMEKTFEEKETTQGQDETDVSEDPPPFEEQAVHELPPALDTIQALIAVSNE